MAGNNRVQYTIGVNADTKQADAQLTKLSSTLDKIQQQSMKGISVDLKLDRAAESAKILQTTLQKAVNVDTGKLNLSKFNSELSSAGMSLQQLASNLVSAGGDGSVAFTQLAGAIANAEVPIKRMNSTLANFGTTLKNTVKWELASKMVHGLESFLSGAISYAKDLNGTLNDIRIVTGASIADMGKFADQANKMAKELSATTQEVAKASLIYYQQGDSAELAAKKAAITTKAANVAFTASAQEMSEMLTAVWNSFQMGEDQLEHAVDVMAVLGATTASSMEEMATSMQKVAATANNVGVSMEQMSAIVATSASVTRQAPQVIGTAWNTILSRLGGLKLGETLEDGVDLNKYSKALASIGVEVLDATGNLKDMGGVVDEIGAKWNTMTRAQQSALAQTIGGTRQYTQILAFFDNFEKYQKNLETANNADGALNKQAEIYAQSWEAASKRQKAAMQGVFRQVIDDEAIIKVTNSLTGLIEKIGDVIKGFGGVQGILLTIGNLATKIFNSQITKGFDTVFKHVGSFGGAIKNAWNASGEHAATNENGRTIYRDQNTGLGVTSRLDESGHPHLARMARFVGVMHQQGNYELREQRAALQSVRAGMQNSISEPSTQAESVALSANQQLLDLKEKLINSEYRMSAAQQANAAKTLEGLTEESNKLTELVSKYDQIQQAAERQNQYAVDDIYRNASKNGLRITRSRMNTARIPASVDERVYLRQRLNEFTNNQALSSAWSNIATDAQKNKFNVSDTYLGEQNKNNWNAFYERTLGQRVGQMAILATKGEDAKALKSQYSYVGKLYKDGASRDEINNAVKDLVSLMKKMGEAGSDAVQDITKEFEKLGPNAQKFVNKALDEARQKADEQVETSADIGTQEGRVTAGQRELEERLHDQEKFGEKAAKAMGKLSSAAMSSLASLNAMQNTWNVMSDDAANFGQKATSILSSVGNLASAWSQGWVSGITATVAAGVGALISALEQTEQAEQESRKRISERINTQAQELTDSTQKAVDALSEYQQLKESFEQGEINRAEYTEKLTGIVNSLEIEGTSVATLTQNYRELEKAIKGATEERLSSNSEQALTDYRNAQYQTQALLLSAKEQDQSSHIDLAKYAGSSTQAISADFLWRMTGTSTYDAGLGNNATYQKYRDEHGYDNDQAAFELLFGGLSSDIVKRVKGSGIDFQGANDLVFDTSEESLVILKNRFEELKQLAADVTNPMHEVYGQIVNSIPVQNLESYINAALDPLRKFETVSMTSLAAEFTGGINKKTFEANYKNNPEQYGRDALIEQIIETWKSNGIDVAKYGEDDAKAIAEQYTDAFLAQFSNLSLETASEKDASSMRDQVFELLDKILPKEQADQIKEVIKSKWESIFKSIFADMDNPYGFDWSSLIGQTAGQNGDYGLEQSLGAFASYNKAVTKYERLANYNGNSNTLTIDDLDDILNVLDDVDISNFFDGTYKTVDAVKKAIEDKSLDKGAALQIVLSGINENLLSYYNAIIDPANVLRTQIEAQEEQIRGEWKEIKPQNYEGELEQFYKEGQLVANLPSVANKDNIDALHRDQDLIDSIVKLVTLHPEIIKNSKIASYNKEAFFDPEKLSKLGSLYFDQGLQVIHDYYSSDKMKTISPWYDFLTKGSKVEYGASTNKKSSLPEWLQAIVSKQEEEKLAKEEAEKLRKDNRAVAKQNITDLQNLNLKKLDIIDGQTQQLLGLTNEETIGFHRLTTQEQEDYITRALKANRTKLAESYVEGEEWSNEDKQLYEILNQLIQERDNATQKASYEAAYEAFTIDLKDQQTKLTKMSAGANVLLQNYQTGDLTNAQLNTLAQSGLGQLVEDYQTVATAQERLNIASQAYSQYLIQQEQYLTNQNSLYNEISGYIKHESRDFAKLEKITDPDQFINNYFRVSKESKELLENIMADVAKNKGYAKITDVPVQEMLAGIQEYCSKAISENQLAYNQIEADGKDAIQAIWKSAADEVSQAAQTAVDKWTKAFETISKARQKLLKGENILEDLINDPESYRIVAEQWYEKYGSYDGLNQALSSGQGLEFLQNPSFNDSIKAQQAQQGIDIINHWMDKWGDRINLGEYRTSVIQDKRSQYFKDHPELDYDSEAWYASDEYKNAVGTADEIIKTQLLSLLTYANQYTEQEANELIDRFFNHEDIGLNEIANKNSQLIALQAEGQNIVTTKTEAESANADVLENIQTAHEILSGVVGGSAKNEHWYDELKPAKFEELANVLGVTEKQLRSWSLEQVQAKFLSLSSALDAASAAAKNFDKAVSAGAFNNKRVSGYTTSSGERIWDSDENKVVVQDHNKKGYDTYEEAFKEAQLGQQVVYGSDGKWHTIVGGETESAIVQQASQEGKIQLEKESTTNQEEARATLSEAETETESEWISKRTAEFEKLEDLQKAVYNPKSSQDTIDNKWESLYKTLDMTIPAIQDAYDHMRTATEGTEEWDIALDELTTAIIKQGDVQIKDTEQLKIATKQWLNQCGITDKYGKQLNALSIQAIRASNNTKTLSKAVEFLGSVSKKAAGDEGTDDLRENLETLRKQAKKTGKEFDKYVDDLDDLTDAEKEAVKETNKFYKALDDLSESDASSNVDEELANMIENAEDMDSAIDGVLKSLVNYSADDAISNTQDLFTTLADSLSQESAEAKAQIEADLGADADDIVAFCEFVGDQLAQCGGNWSQIDWGEMNAELKANLSDPISLLTKLIGLANTMSNIPWLKIPGGLLGALQAALSQAQSIQGKHGGGGSSAKNEKPKSSGGGGGGGDKTKKSLEKMQEDEKERYHEITKRIDEQSKALNKLDKIKSAAFGVDRIKAINDEITALKKEKILYQELATEANHNLATNRSALAGFGATFNSDGTVNYDEFMNKIRREYNEAVEEYNDTDKEDQKKAKIDLDYAKERYEKAKKALEDYEEDMEKVQDAEENLLDIINQISAKTLEEIEYKIEVKFDINDRDIKYMQYLRNKWEDVLDKADESMEQMINEAKEYENNLSVLQTANNDLYKQYNEGNLTAADFAEGLKEINDKSIEMLENLITIKKSIKEAYGNALETANNELEKHTAVLEHSYSMMEKYIQIQQLIGMGTDYTGLKQMYEFQYKSSLASVEAAKLYLDVLKDEEVALQAQIDAYGWTEVLKQQWEDLQERIRDGESDLAEKTNQTLTTAQNAFSNAIKAAIEKFDEFVFGVRGGLSKLEADYQYYQEEQERYLSTSKELYEVAKLNREINGSLDEVTSQLTKTRLRELQEEIKSLSEKNRLTEYDVQMLELQYKYALALEDLEDKKNAKSIVRLTRDENGNYGYQYTADSDEIDKAAQQVDDVLQQINELAANRTAEIEQAAISAQRNYYDNLEQISNDTSLSIEERQARIEELTQRYAETMQFNQEQYNNATNALLTNQEYVYKRYGTSIMENTGMIQDQMNSAITAMINKTDDWSSYLSTQLQPGGDIYEALENYKKQLDETNISAGLGNRQQAVQNMTNSIDDLTEANEAADEAIRNIADTLDDTLKNINAQTIAWQDLTKSIQDAIDAYEQLAQTSGNKISELGENVVNTGVGGEEIKTKSKNLYTYTWVDEYGIMHPGEWSYDSYSSAMEGAEQNIKSFYSSYLTAGEDDAETAANKATYDSLVDAALGTRSAPSTTVATFLHGGMIDFTGPAWVDGSTSSPESILNAGDTAKMLRMTELIHNIDLEALRLLYESINQSALGMMYPLNGLLNSQSINPFATELQQHVTITAEFPNATDHSEIEQAFEDIVNLAAQYAGRK